jgi:hypothetical protein
MHVFFINKYQTEFTESIDKIYIDIFLKHGLLNFHGTFPYLYTVAESEPESQASLHLTYCLRILLNQGKY